MTNGTQRASARSVWRCEANESYSCMAMIALSSGETELGQGIGHRHHVCIGIRPVAVNEVDVRWYKSEVIQYSK